MRVSGSKHAIRWRHWKFIYSPEELGYELFDLSKDPRELDNIAGLRRDLVMTLSTELSDWHGSQKPLSAGDSGEISDEVRERLEALGYVD